MRTNAFAAFAIVAIPFLAYEAALRADDPPAKFELSKEEKKLLELTNKEREKEKLPPLKPNPLLFKIARAHSANMAKHGKMAHELDDKNPVDRLKEGNYKYMAYGENVAYGQENLEELVKGWMDSKGHRMNILGKQFTEIGLGIARTRDGVPYFTQVFGTPRRR
jgi:uncharacterized protein YkwD